jgi:mannose-1-phosphate guanylyltransferase
MSNNYVVVMAGGAGTRFWPFSREKNPKQFHDVLGTGKTLLQQTVERFEGLVPSENIYIATAADYYAITKEQLPFLKDEQILLEPARRNTAPCIAYACYKIYHKNPQALIVVAPSDHIILDSPSFKTRISEALSFAAFNEAIVTLGISPTRPDTGYGYIQFEENENSNIKAVKTFTEKPTLEKAQGFLTSGDFVWNAGIFIWSAQTIVDAFENLLPEMAGIFEAMRPVFFTPKEQGRLEQDYPICQNVSIDYGIMERAKNVFVIPSSFGWSDLGTWKSLHETSTKDENQNALDGHIVTTNVKDCIIKTPKDKLVVVHGLEGFIVAEHGNVLMICKKDDEQKVKDFVAMAKGLGPKYV